MPTSTQDWASSYNLLRDNLRERNSSLKSMKHHHRVQQLYSLMPKELRSLTEKRVGKSFTIETPVLRTNETYSRLQQMRTMKLHKQHSSTEVELQKLRNQAQQNQAKVAIRETRVRLRSRQSTDLKPHSHYVKVPL